jgi:hypothetical protein
LTVQGDLEADQLQTGGNFLKLKGGALGTQILDENDGLLLEASSAGVSVLQNFNVLANTTFAAAIVTNTSGTGYASMYVRASGVEGQMYTGAGIMSLSTNTNHKMVFATNRFINSTSLTVESNGSVVCNTSFQNNSDSKLKDNQTIANIDDMQSIFDNVEVKTYERNDLNGQKRVGFIANEFEAVLPDYAKHIVGTGSLKRSEDAEEEEIRTLDYGRLTSILWSVCKNLQRRIEVLESR